MSFFLIICVKSPHNIFYLCKQVSFCLIFFSTCFFVLGNYIAIIVLLGFLLVLQYFMFLYIIRFNFWRFCQALVDSWHFFENSFLEPCNLHNLKIFGLISKIFKKRKRISEIHSEEEEEKQRILEKNNESVKGLKPKPSKNSLFCCLFNCFSRRNSQNYENSEEFEKSNSFEEEKLDFLHDPFESIAFRFLSIFSITFFILGIGFVVFLLQVVFAGWISASIFFGMEFLFCFFIFTRINYSSRFFIIFFKNSSFFFSHFLTLFLQKETTFWGFS